MRHIGLIGNFNFWIQEDLRYYKTIVIVNENPPITMEILLLDGLFEGGKATALKNGKGVVKADVEPADGVNEFASGAIRPKNMAFHRSADLPAVSKTLKSRYVRPASSVADRI
jgi:hypothetical protein